MNRVVPFVLLVSLISSQQLIELKDATFSQITKIPTQFKRNFTLDSDWFIMFYAPWCGHCKHALPEWVKLASVYTNNTYIAVVNCDNNPAICSAVSVHGYPSLVLFKRNGVAYDYRSARKYEAFVKFLDGEYTQHPERQLKKVSVGQHLYEFVNSLDAFSLMVVASLVATFWFIVFRFFFSERTQEIVPQKKNE